MVDVETAARSSPRNTNLAPGNYYYNRLQRFNHPKAFNYSFRIMMDFQQGFKLKVKIDQRFLTKPKSNEPNTDLNVITKLNTDLIKAFADLKLPNLLSNDFQAT